MKNKFLILTMAMICSFALTACTASEKTASDRGTASGGSPQIKSADNKTAENKSVETRKTAEREILWDFRKTELRKSLKFSEAETSVVLKYLLETDSWDKDLNIANRFQGSFTKANAKETLYYVTGCQVDGKFVSNTTCGHAGWDTAGWIAVFDGTTPVLKIEQALGNGIEKITDLNGDGINEFLSYSSYGQSGIYNASVTLGQISDGKYEAFKESSGSYGWNCAFGGDKKDSELSARTTVISYIPTNDGKMPEFFKEYYKGQCKDGEVDKSSWKPTDQKDLEDFINSIS